MPDLLLELFSEEIPARMQGRASEDLKKLVTDGLVNAGLTYESAKGFATPRRLALTVTGVPVRSPDLMEEKKGPRVGAPEQAIAGFLKGAGLASLDEATIIPDKKGDFYVARLKKPGRPALDIIADLIPGIVRTFPWPKSQRWGTGTLRWVRPLQSILATFGPETEEPEIVRFEVDGIASGNTTKGHRFLAPDVISVRRFDDYVEKLAKAKVILDPARRRDVILADAKTLAHANGFELIEDEGLLEEVAGLVEWPVVLMGAFEEEFLKVPGEVIRATIRANQKCFVLKDPKTGGLANRFILVSNVEAKDGGEAITAGNGRVIRARLSDARHFFETDLKALPDYADKAEKPLDQRLEKLKALNVVFHEKLGTQFARVERIVRLAREIAPIVGADPEKAARAAYLAKADLMTEVVGEFPEVQGLMGRYYAEAQGEDAAVAKAIEDHYKPQGPSDRVPTEPVAIAVALADKLDTLVGFWAIDEKPTGSKDPYQLRRAALGVIRIVLENGVRVDLGKIFLSAHHIRNSGNLVPFFDDLPPWGSDLLAFFHDRLKVQLREQGIRHDLVDAVLAAPPSLPLPLKGGGNDGAASIGSASTAGAAAKAAASGVPSPLEGEGQGERSLPSASTADLVRVVNLVQALQSFLTTEDGKNLLAGYVRAANILKAEEKKTGETYGGEINAALLALPEEKALAQAIAEAMPKASAAVETEDFAGAMAALATLRAPVDAFFDKVLVNDADAGVRLNRLALLTRIREACHRVADFGKISG